MTNQPLGADGPGVFTRDRLTFLAYGLTFTFGYAVAALGPAMPLIREDLGISRTVGGLHFTLLAAGSVLTGLAVGRIVPLWGRRRLFWTGGAGVAVGSLLIASGWHPAVTMAGCLLAGAAGSATLITVQASLSDRHSMNRPVALTEANMATSVGTVVPALVIGALVAVGAGWRPAFLAPAALWIALFVALRSEQFPPVRTTGRPVHRKRLPAAYWFLWMGFIPAVGAEWSVGAWGADYLVTVAGTTEGTASFLMAAFFGAMVAGRFLGSRVARRVKPFPLLVGTTTLGLGGAMLLWGSTATPLVVAGLFLTGLGISMLFPMLLSLAIGIVPDRPDRAAARIAIAAGGAVIVAPLTLGALADQSGIRGAFGLVPGLLVFVVLFAALGRRANAASQQPVRS
ncbi:MAG: MFS transporter [Acidimicrobiia bacterium]|nr:MFS transporter [Acidimicrobiia bacterium]